MELQVGLTIGKSMKWWEKGLQPNMKEIQSAQDLVDSLLHSDNQLVILDFFSPGCGGCRALHPKVYIKITQFFQKYKRTSFPLVCIFLFKEDEKDIIFIQLKKDLIFIHFFTLFFFFCRSVRLLSRIQMFSSSK